MDTSLLLAKFIGIFMTVVGVAIAKSPDYFRDLGKEYPNDKVGSYLGKLMALIIGILIVVTHNIWVMGWPVLITLFGWMSLIKGTALLIIPEHTHRFYGWLLERLNYRIVGAVYALIGLFLAWKGFF